MNKYFSFQIYIIRLFQWPWLFIIAVDASAANALRTFDIDTDSTSFNALVSSNWPSSVEEMVLSLKLLYAFFFFDFKILKNTPSVF